jgi:PAS domain S-box-containing protein
MTETDQSNVWDRLAEAQARIAMLERNLASRQEAETTARLGEDRLNLIIASSRVGAWDLMLPTKTVRMSATCKAIFGMRPDESFAADVFRAAIVPGDVKMYQAKVRAAVHDASDLDVTYRYVRPDGEMRWIEVRGRANLGPQGERQSLSGVAIDVTDRKIAEAGIAEREAHYRAISDSIDQMIWSTLPDGFHDYYNHRWYEFTGVPAGSTDGEAWNGMFHPDDQERAWGVWRHCLETGEPYHIEYRLRHRSGQYRWVLGRAQPVRDDDGAIVRWYGTCTDIHDFKIADERVRELEERYRLAARATSDAIWEWNLDTDALTWNEALKELFGHETLEGHIDDWTGKIHPDDRERIETGIQDVIDGTASRWTADYRFERANGTYAEVFDRGFVARDADGKPLRIIGAMQDLTERRQAEADLRRLNETLEDRVTERTEELAASNRQLVGQIEERERVAGSLRQMQRLEAVGQLTSGVAHDFNNLLTVILGNLGFIQRGVAGLPNEEKLLRRLGFMEIAAERGAKLTAQLLAFSRRQRLEPKPLDLNVSVGNLRDLLQSTMGGAVRIETVLSPQLWPALVDPTQIELVILNLAINARDAMQVGGSLTVETSNVVLRTPHRRPEEPEPGHYVVVSVCDNGFGMSDEIQAKAFEPFFTTKEVGKGTGLGLSQVLGFAKQSGGGVQIDSRLGEGTVVRVYLPRAGGHAESETLKASPVLRMGTRRAGGTVLLVDDDTAVREVTAALLREAEFNVIEAGSGGAGLEALDRTETVDLLLVDFAMPGMNGAEVAHEALLRRPGLPILFVTGYADLEAIRFVGEDRIVAKPFQPERLFQAIDSLLGTAEDSDANVIRFSR